MTDPTRYLLEVIGDRTNTQARVAGAYAAALQEIELPEWGIVNRAIVQRWSLAGLNRIKKMAWAVAARKYGVR